jgi:anti-anti-sigma factor
MQEINKIKLEKHDMVTLFDIQGDITAASEPYFSEAYNEANEQGANKILLQFEESAYINSGGIAVLIQILAQSNKTGQMIGIIGISNHFKKIFNMVGITKFANIFNTREEALDLMSG